ncbi:glycosyl hydrolase family 26-domain-containing protein [Tricharina praecox]|uniref:glycosyl hydrolase family 26-domain-containing protein n=1 Tax=Tricharina praecox TaxID=43433 RepID=UPI00221F1783|nr:glycosyl hydrolase family 26-domain-containing protein [Tricharina praecox]KAI5854339.1 glycosyl hydrolase family 26-domain-containing protein [Tricharina praecox]
MLVNFLAFLAVLPAVLAQTVTYQAETGALNGVTIGTSQTGFTGTGYVEGFDADADTVTFTVTSTAQKLYDLVILYSSPSGAKYTTVVLNGSGGSQVALAAATGWTTASGGQVLLAAGTNTIALQSNWGWYLIDAITLTPSAARPAHQVTTALVNTNSSPATKALMKLLVDNYGSYILSGQQDPPSLAWIETNIGETPAVLGLDMIEYSPSRVARGSTSTAVEDAIAFDARGGVVTFCWHWNAPVGLYDVTGKEWWRGFYTDSVDFDISTALASTTNANYTLLIRDIDAIAVQLKRLQAANVPILWRPLHEAEGGWFWWGAKGAEPAKKLYGIVYDRLTNYHGLNNLIWVWNSVASDWYPGASTVDILSYDSYPATVGDHGPVSAQYNALYALGGDKKLIGLSENGAIPDPDQLQLYDSDWSWFVTWTGEFLTAGTHNTLDFLKKVYASSYVKNLSDIKGWKTGTAAVSSSTTTPTTVVSSSKISSAAPSASTTAASGTVPKYGQCGGTSYTGPTTCVSGSTCTAVSPPYYYQCL